MMVPPVLVLVVLLYHWYDIVPIPPVTAIVKSVGMLFWQSVWVFKGCVLTIGSATTITSAVLEVVLPQPLPLSVMVA